MFIQDEKIPAQEGLCESVWLKTNKEMVTNVRGAKTHRKLETELSTILTERPKSPQQKPSPMM